MLVNESFQTTLTLQQELEGLKKNVDYFFLIIMGSLVLCRSSHNNLPSDIKCNTIDFTSFTARIRPLRNGCRPSEECCQHSITQSGHAEYVI